MPGSYISSRSMGDIAGDNNHVPHASWNPRTPPVTTFQAPPRLLPSRETSSDRQRKHRKFVPFSLAAWRHYLKISKLYKYTYRVALEREAFRITSWVDMWLFLCQCLWGLSAPQTLRPRNPIARPPYAHISAWYDSLTTLNLHCSCRSLFMEKRTGRASANIWLREGQRGGQPIPPTYTNAIWCLALSPKCPSFGFGYN